MKFVFLSVVIGLLAVIAFTPGLARSIGEKLHDAVFAHMARSGMVLGMADIDKTFVTQWDTSLRLAAQQQQSRLRSTVVDRGTIEGSSFTIANIGTTELDEKVVRLADTEWGDILFGVRNAPMRDFYRALPLDRSDIPKMIVNPVTGGQYMANLIAARNRKVDQIIYQAALGTIMGQDGTTTYTLPSSQKIVGGGTGLTKAKVIQAKQIMRANEVDNYGDGKQLYMLYNNVAMGQILSDTTLTSADFLAAQMLQKGEITDWMGFKWIPYEKLNVSGGVYSTVAYTGDAIHFGNGYEEGMVSRRPDKQDAWQVSMAASYGAGRQDEKKVVQIDFQ